MPTGQEPSLHGPSTTTTTTDPQKQEDSTQEYTIKSVNTGLRGDHVRETVEVDGEEYSAGDEVSLTEAQHKSLKDAGVKFES